MENLQNEFEQSSEMNQEQSTDEAAPSLGQQDGQDASQTQQQKEAQAIYELEKLQKFKFDGQEWDPNSLKKAILRNKDYTVKTQELAQERKFYENLYYDLDHVKNNPSAIEQFKQIYPEKFHSYLNSVLEATNSKDTGQRDGKKGEDSLDKSQLPPEFQERLTRLERMEADWREGQVKAAEQQIDAMTEKLASKYPYADSEAALARAYSLNQKGVNLTEKVWENIYKSLHDSLSSKIEAGQKKQMQSQLQASKQAKDVGAGGATPSTPPRQPRTLKEATELARQDAMFRD
jgi:hypothetical protein